MEKGVFRQIGFLLIFFRGSRSTKVRRQKITYKWIRNVFETFKAAISFVKLFQIVSKGDKQTSVKNDG
jgi:hypothetical protein